MIHLETENTDNPTERRLDFWLVDNDLQEEIDQANIIPSIKTDYSAILLSINRIGEQVCGPSFWKFNGSLLDDKDYNHINFRKCLQN